MQIKTDTVSRHSSIFCYIQENKEECDTECWCEGKYANKRYEQAELFQVITVVFIVKVVLIFSESSVYVEKNNVKEKQEVDF